ncbi:hypothetical protein [Brucella sp. NBRC 12953]|uniref:hypothetical protein n=1 Tax=Brucella sp. NBRC 12953 TaxID=3075481 RepID=UPI003340B472
MTRRTVVASIGAIEAAKLCGRRILMTRIVQARNHLRLDGGKSSRRRFPVYRISVFRQ